MTAKSDRVERSDVMTVAMVRRAIRSSESTKARYSPVAAAIPVLRAALRPPSDAPVALPGALGDGQAAVGRTVVHHDDLEVQVGLVRDAPQARREVGLDVVDGHHDADLRRPGERH
jgi:hypothetical protein